MKRTTIAFALLLWGQVAFATPQTLTCDSTQQIIQGSGFTVGFTCTASADALPFVPMGSHFFNGGLFIFDYSVTLISSQIQGLALSGTYFASAHDDSTPPSTWTLSGIGNSVDFTASGYIEEANQFTISGPAGTVVFYAPGPVPENPSLVLCLLGISVLSLGGLLHVR